MAAGQRAAACESYHQWSYYLLADVFVAEATSLKTLVATAARCSHVGILFDMVVLWEPTKYIVIGTTPPYILCIYMDNY